MPADDDGDLESTMTETAAPHPATYTPTDRTVPTRSRERAAYDHEMVHSILDEGYVCHLGFVRDGAPVVLPTLYGRVGERLYVHGSTGSRPLRMAGQADPGLPVCLTVTHVDGLVLARSAFHHSINYRSVVVFGRPRALTDDTEKLAALRAISEHVLPGRWRGAGTVAEGATGNDGAGARARRGVGEGAHGSTPRRRGRHGPAGVGGRAAGGGGCR